MRHKEIMLDFREVSRNEKIAVTDIGTYQIYADTSDEPLEVYFRPAGKGWDQAQMVAESLVDDHDALLAAQKHYDTKKTEVTA